MLFVAVAAAAPTSLYLPTAAPVAGRSLELHGTATLLAADFEAYANFRAGARFVAPLGRRLTLDAVMGVRQVFPGIEPEGELVGRLMWTAVDRPNLRVGLLAAAGNEVAVGASFWVRSPSDRITFDATVQYAHHLQWFPGQSWLNPYGIVAPRRERLHLLPEVGVDFEVNGSGTLVFRVGMWGYTPNVGLHVESGKVVTLSFTAGVLPSEAWGGAVAATEFGFRF